MKKLYILLLVLFVLALLFLTPSSAKSDIEPIEEVVEPVIVLSHQELIEKYAKEYKVSAPLIKEIIILETGGTEDCEKLQSKILYKSDHPEWGVKKGEYEKSFGCVQIHLPSHKNITYEQATNRDFSIRFIASEIAQGRARQWSCYNTAKYNLSVGKSGGKCTL